MFFGFFLSHIVLMTFHFDSISKKGASSSAVEHEAAHLWSSTKLKIRETLNVIFCHINLFIYLIMVNLMETCFRQVGKVIYIYIF